MAQPAVAGRDAGKQLERRGGSLALRLAARGRALVGWWVRSVATLPPVVSK